METSVAVSGHQTDVRMIPSLELRGPPELHAVGGKPEVPPREELSSLGKIPHSSVRPLGRPEGS